MSPSRSTVFALLLLSSACEVEPTPDVYFDHQTSVEDEGEFVAAEVRDRVLAMAQALGRGNAGDAVTALAPARDVHVVGPEAGVDVAGAEQIGAILESLAARPVAIHARNVVVDVGPRANVAWFRALLEADEEGRPSMRITGVYVLNEGALELVQAHLSEAVMAPPPPAPSDSQVVAGDSAGGE